MLRLLFLLFALCCLDCQSEQPAPAVTEIKTDTYLIPEAGIRAGFPIPPTFTSGQNTSMEGFFSEMRSYDWNSQYNDSSTYGRHVGVYWNRGWVDYESPLETGLQMDKKMLKSEGLKTLLIEKTKFLGIEAYKIKAFKPADKKLSIRPFYVSIILFSRAGYLVELSVFNAVRQDELWKDDAFFQSIVLGDVTPEAVVSKYYEDFEAGDFCLFLPCYLAHERAILHFPGAPVFKKVQHKNMVIARYYQTPLKDGPILMYGVEFLEPGDSLTRTFNAGHSVLDMLLNIRSLDPELKEQEITRTGIRYKGKEAVEMNLKAALPATVDGLKEIMIRRIFFMHNGNLINLFVFSKQDEPEDESVRCFFESANFW